uniref:Uncharacterized protein n=1 Tax=Oryza sativa subsp. japonica TaxID=39947 RepID=Q69ND3_ORYSJ|nr:hypothetical protein [Oryza sativa Japonica Group]
MAAAGFGAHGQIRWPVSGTGEGVVAASPLGEEATAITGAGPTGHLRPYLTEAQPVQRTDGGYIGAERWRRGMRSGGVTGSDRGQLGVLVGDAGAVVPTRQRRLDGGGALEHQLWISR